MRAIGIVLGIIGLAASALLPATAADMPPVTGTASIVAGPASVVRRDGESRTLVKGDAVYSGDRVLTGANAYVRLGFLDGGSMVLRPQSEFAIQDFRFTPGEVQAPVQVVPPPSALVGATLPLKVGEQQSRVGNVALFRLLRGGFRAVSGLIGKVNREEYAVATPVATIGIRGTVFWSVSCDAACAADPVVQGVVPAGEAALGGTVSAVDQGSIVIVSTAGNSVGVDASQLMLTTASGKHVALARLPGFLTGEDWLNAAAEAAAPTAQGAAASPLTAATLSTVPAVGSLALAAVIGIAVIATDSDDDNDGGGSPPTGTTTTSTR